MSEAINLNKGRQAAQAAAATVTTVTDATLTQEMGDNTIYNCGELDELEIEVPETVAPGYASQINFSSGDPATQFTAPEGMAWAGDDLDENNVFIPSSGRRYIVILHSDGSAVRGLAQGVDLPAGEGGGNE